MALPKLVSLPQLQGLFQTCRWRCGWQCFESPSNTSENETFEDVVASALSRRSFLKQALASAFVLAAAPQYAAAAQAPVRTPDFLGTFADLDFTPVALSTEDRLIVPPGYAADVVMRWGDSVLPDAPPFELSRQTARAQRLQFGYNSDFVAFMPLPAGTRSSDHGLLYVNHEYTNPELMFPGYNGEAPTRDQIEIEIAAHGASVVEIRRDDSGPWKRVPASRRNFRITGDSPHIVTGPAAGHPLLRTREDSTGTRVRGTFNNCGGGQDAVGHRPHRRGELPPVLRQRIGALGRRTGEPDATRATACRRTRRAAVGDSRTTASTSRRSRTSRSASAGSSRSIRTTRPSSRASAPRWAGMKHEAATRGRPDGRVVVYTGDDERFEYVYKFVSTGTVHPDDRAHNLTCSTTARSTSPGSTTTAPASGCRCVHGQGPLTAANGFAPRPTC